MSSEPIQVRSLRRYPVKSMAGESLQQIRVDGRGLVGDRTYAVVDEQGRLASGKDSRRFRRRDEVFSFGARTRDDGSVWVADASGEAEAGSAELDRRLTQVMGEPVRVLAETETPYFDAGSVSLVGTATLAWCAEHLGVDADPRRLRVNLVVDTEEPFAEEEWLGKPVLIGGCALEVESRVPRCRMIDVDQDGAPAAVPWLKPLGQARDAQVAVYARVVVPGLISVGDRVSA